MHWFVGWAIIVLCIIIGVFGGYAKGRYDERRKFRNEYRKGKGFISLLRKRGM